MKINMIPRRITESEMGRIALFPSYESDTREFRKLKENVHYRAEVKRPRNLKHHNKLFAIMRMVIDNDPYGRWASEDELLFALKMELKLFEVVPGLDGEVGLMEKSINFESMDEDEFTDKVYVPSLKKMAQAIGVTVEDLENNFGEYM